MVFTSKRPLRIGTDCSGIDAPVMAVRKLKLPFIHVFSSEIDKHCISSLRANYSPEILFGDIQKREIKDVPDIDLYVCGFPCQPFSTAGSRSGVRDHRGRLFWECVRVIMDKKPSLFILENVSGLISINNGSTFHHMLNTLKKIDGYNIFWKILNTLDYGIPQSRKRVFIVGILKIKQKACFEWPSPIPRRSLSSFIERNVNSIITPPPSIIRKVHTAMKTLPKGSKFIDLSFQHTIFPNSDRVCPALLASSILWCIPENRYATIREHLRLQGFPANFKQVVSDRQMKKQVGNSMTVDVMKHLIKNLICVI